MSVEKELFSANCREVLALVEHGDELGYEGGDELHAELREIFPDTTGTVKPGFRMLFIFNRSGSSDLKLILIRIPDPDRIFSVFNHHKLL